MASGAGEGGFAEPVKAAAAFAVAEPVGAIASRLGVATAIAEAATVARLALFSWEGAVSRASCPLKRPRAIGMGSGG